MLWYIDDVYNEYYLYKWKKVLDNMYDYNKVLFINLVE